MDNVIKRVKLHEKVMYRIKELIAEGKFKEGSKLPSAESLASTFGVSRTVIREALRLLESMGIVDIIPGKGTFVKSNLDNNCLDSISVVLQSSQGLILDLLEFREIIEPGIAAIAAVRRTAGDLKSLENHLNDMKREIEEKKLGINPSLKFHLTLAKATENPIVIRIMLLLGIMLRESREVSLSMPERRERALQEHSKILNAIKAKDPKGAEESMKEHLKNLRKTLTDAMSKE